MYLNFHDYDILNEGYRNIKATLNGDAIYTVTIVKDLKVVGGKVVKEGKRADKGTVVISTKNVEVTTVMARLVKEGNTAIDIVQKQGTYYIGCKIELLLRGIIEKVYYITNLKEIKGNSYFEESVDDYYKRIISNLLGLLLQDSNERMEAIDKALDERQDILLYINNDINAIKEWVGAIEEGIDITGGKSYSGRYFEYYRTRGDINNRCIYANAESIGVMRKAWKEGIDLRDYVSTYNASQLEVIYAALKSGLDVSQIAQRGYDAQKMKLIMQKMQGAGPEIKNAKGKSVDIDYSMFNAKQIEQIEMGAKSGVDVTKYAKPRYDSEQMMQIRLGLEHKVDIKKYYYTKYSSEKMKAIRLCLERGVDITPYVVNDTYVGESEARGIYSAIKAGVPSELIMDNRNRNFKLETITNWVKAGYTIEEYEELSRIGIEYLDPYIIKCRQSGLSMEELRAEWEKTKAEQIESKRRSSLINYIYNINLYSKIKHKDYSAYKRRLINMGEGLYGNYIQQIMNQGEDLEVYAPREEYNYKELEIMLTYVREGVIDLLLPNIITNKVKLSDDQIEGIYLYKQYIRDTATFRAVLKQGLARDEVYKIIDAKCR